MREKRKKNLTLNIMKVFNFIDRKALKKNRKSY